MENKSLKQIIDNRLEKLKKIRELGFEPYAYDFNQTHHSSQITEDLIDSKVHLAFEREFFLKSFFPIIKRGHTFLLINARFCKKMSLNDFYHLNLRKSIVI